MTQQTPENITYPLIDRRAPQPEKWHLKKELQLGQIASILIFGLGGIFYVTKMDQRIAIIENQIVQQRDRDALQDKVQGDTLNRIQSQLERLENKLDRIVEKQR